MTAYSLLNLRPAIGCAGVSSWKDHYKHLLDGFQHVIVLCDNDDKGQGSEFGDAIVSKLPEQDVTKILMPKGHDVNSAYLDGGKENLIDWIQGTFKPEQPA